jgi:AAA15 family ATPase/GTPase
MLKEFTVENFKGFEKLTLEDLGHINIFVGKNNTGKTSLLEAVGYSDLVEESNYVFFQRLLSLLSGMPVGLNKAILPDVFLNTVYANSSDKKTAFQFNIKKQEKLNVIELELSYQVLFQEITAEIKILKRNQRKELHPYRVEPSFKISTAPNLNHHFEFNLAHFPLIIFSHHISHREFVYQQYSEIIKDSNKTIKNKIKELLKKIEPRLEDLQLVMNGGIVCDIEGLEKSLPLDNMGDGFIKLFAFACLLHQKSSLVLVDEPENGLHYSAQKQFWEMLSDACLNNGKQSFIATHSYELLESLNKLLLADPNLTKPEDEGGKGLKVRVYRLKRSDTGEVKVSKIKEDTLARFLARKEEIR